MRKMLEAGAGRTTGRWLGVIAMTAALTLAAVGCTADSGAMSKKNAGKDAGVQAVAGPSGEPVELVTAKQADGGDGRDLIPDKVEDELAAAPGSEPVAIKGDGKPVPLPEDPAAEARDKALLGSGGLGDVVPKMDMTIITDTALDRAALSLTNGFALCPGSRTNNDRPSYRIAAGETHNYCFFPERPLTGGTDAIVDVRYAIAGTKDLVWIKSVVPLWGDNTLWCEIVTKEGKSAISSDYACTFAWTADGGHGSNPKPKVVIKKKPVETITNLAEAQKLLKANCGDGQPECHYETAKQVVMEQPESRWKRIGGPYTNCNGQTPEPHEVTEKVEISWEDAFSVKGGFELSLIKDVLNTSVEVAYRHSVTETRSWEEKRTGFVEYGRTHIFYVQAGVLHIEGDFRIVKRDKVYLLPDMVFEIPLSQDWVPNDGHGQTVAAKHTISASFATACKNGVPAQKVDVPVIGLPKGVQDIDIQTAKTP